MNAVENKAHRAGRYVQRTTGYRAFIPAPLPPMEKLFNHPIVTVARVRQWLKVTPAGANNLVNRLVEVGLLREITGYAMPQPVAQIGSASKVPRAVARLPDSLLWLVPWAHHVILMEKVKDLSTRRWYMEHTQANGWNRNRMEQACNRVAAEFLVPERELRRVWPTAQQSLEPFPAIARQFKVSVLVAARRALDLSLITRAMFLEFYRAYKADERRRRAARSEGDNFYASQNLRLGRRFAETVVRATKEGKLLYHEAYQLTGLYGNAFERYAEALGFGAAG